MLGPPGGPANCKPAGSCGIVDGCCCCPAELRRPAATIRRAGAAAAGAPPAGTGSGLEAAAGELDAFLVQLAEAISQAEQTQADLQRQYDEAAASLQQVLDALGGGAA